MKPPAWRLRSPEEGIALFPLAPPLEVPSHPIPFLPRLWEWTRCPVRCGLLGVCLMVMLGNLADGAEG